MPKVASHLCPNCDEAIDARSIYWRVCAGCLARHHPGCWRAGNGCAVCRDSLALRHPQAPSGRGGESWPLRFALCGALILLLGVSLQLAYLLQAQRRQTRLLEQRYEAEAQRSRDLWREVSDLKLRYDSTSPP